MFSSFVSAVLLPALWRVGRMEKNTFSTDFRKHLESLVSSIYMYIYVFVADVQHLECMQARELGAAWGELKHVPKYVTDCGGGGGDFENPLPVCCNCCDRNHLKAHSESRALRDPWCSKGFLRVPSTLR